MKRTAPGELAGPRAYFTAFDPRIVARSDDCEQLRRSCERRLKLLMLLKSRIVCAASHLQSPVAAAIFREYPFLLEDAHIVPAMRSTAGTVREAFELSGDHEEAPPCDLAAFYDDHVAEVVTWQADDAAPWFQKRFLDGLTNPGSVVRLNAKGIPDEMVQRFADRFADGSQMDRGDVDRWAALLAPPDRRVVLTFRELIYHVSGARAVNCEGSLPQEEYLDFDLADLSQRRTRLSEHLVFWKLFIELAFATLNKRTVSIDLLDSLEFSDVVAIRRPLLEANFQQRYDQLTSAAIAAARGDGPPLVETVERLDLIRESLQGAFNDVFDLELPAYKRRLAPANQRAVASSGVSVGLGVLGLVPGVGTIASAFGLVKDSVELYMNLSARDARPQDVADLARQRERAIGEIVARFDDGPRQMLDVVTLLTNIVCERMRFP